MAASAAHAGRSGAPRWEMRVAPASVVSRPSAITNSLGFLFAVGLNSGSGSGLSTIPIAKKVDRFLAGHFLGLHQPINVIAMRLADKTVEMIVVDMTARVVVGGVKRAADFNIYLVQTK